MWARIFPSISCNRWPRLGGWCRCRLREHYCSVLRADLYKQPISITVDAATKRPLNSSLVELAPASPLDNTLFNVSAFEFLLHAGFSSLAIDRDYPNSLILDQYAKLYGSNISWPVTNMVGFAVGLHDGPLTDFLNPTVIQESYEAAHKLAFSWVISQLFSRTEYVGSQNVVMNYAAFGIVVSRPFSIAVEVLLVVVACSAVILLGTIIRSASNLGLVLAKILTKFRRFKLCHAQRLSPFDQKNWGQLLESRLFSYLPLLWVSSRISSIKRYRSVVSMIL